MALVARGEHPEGRPLEFSRPAAAAAAAAPAPAPAMADLNLHGDLESIDLRGVRAMLAGAEGPSVAAVTAAKLHGAIEALMVRAKAASRSPQAALLLDAHHVLGQAAVTAQSAHKAELAAVTALLASVVGQAAGVPAALLDSWAAQQLVRLHALATTAPADVVLLCRGWLASLPGVAKRLAALGHGEAVAAVVVLLQPYTVPVRVLASVPTAPLSYALDALLFLRNWANDPATAAPAHLRANAWGCWSAACVLAVTAGADAAAQWGGWAHATLMWAVGTFQAPTATALLVACMPLELQQLWVACMGQRTPAGDGGLSEPSALELAIAAFPYVAEHLSVAMWRNLLEYLGVCVRPNPAAQWGEGWGGAPALGQPAMVDVTLTVAPGPLLAPVAAGVVLALSAALEPAAPATGAQPALPRDEEPDALVEVVDAGLAGAGAHPSPAKLEEARAHAAVAKAAPAQAAPDAVSACVVVHVVADDSAVADAALVLPTPPRYAGGSSSSDEEEDTRVRGSCWPGGPAALAGKVLLPLWRQLRGLCRVRRSGRHSRAVTAA